MISHTCCLHPYTIYSVYRILEKKRTQRQKEWTSQCLLYLRFLRSPQKVHEVHEEGHPFTIGTDHTTGHRWTFGCLKTNCLSTCHHIIPNFNVPTKKRSWLDHTSSSNNIKDTRKRHQTMSRLKKLQTPRFRASQPCVKLILSGQSTNILDWTIRTSISWRSSIPESKSDFLKKIWHKSIQEVAK